VSPNRYRLIDDSAVNEHPSNKDHREIRGRGYARALTTFLATQILASERLLFVTSSLRMAHVGRLASEEKFEKILHSSPVAFSITTLEEGRFLELNAANPATDIAALNCWDVSCTSSGCGMILQTGGCC
jgi:hypothetical protein